MRHQGRVRFARPVHGTVLYHRHSVRHLRRRDHLPVPVGCTVPGARVVRRGGGRGLSRHTHRRLHLGLQEGCFGVGVTSGRLLPSFLLLFGLGALQAAPKLRLSNSAVGPVLVTGSSAPVQSVEAYNIGDGALSPTVVSSVPWISPALAGVRPCLSTRAAASCIPINL